MKRKNWKEMQRLARLCEAHAADAAKADHPAIRYTHESLAAKYAAQAFELARSV